MLVGSGEILHTRLTWKQACDALERLNPLKDGELPTHVMRLYAPAAIGSRDSLGRQMQRGLYE